MKRLLLFVTLLVMCLSLNSCALLRLPGRVLTSVGGAIS